MKAYPEYKTSGIDWLGNVPSHWEGTRFKYFLDQITTPSISIHKVALENIESATGRYIETSSEFDGNGIGFIVGDILYGKLRPYLQKVWLAEFDGNAIGDFFVYRPLNNATSEYIKWLLLSDSFTRIANQSTEGAKMPRVSNDFIRNLSFYLPPIEEQTAIARYLDEVTANINSLMDEKQAQVEDLRKYRSSVITEIVTHGLNPDVSLRPSGIDWLGDIPEHWNDTKLKYLVTKVGSGITPRGGAEVYSDSGILFLRSQNIYDDGLHLDDPKYISTEIDEDMSNSRVFKNDLLLNITGASIGRCCLYNLEESANVNQHVCIVRVMEKISPLYLKLVINSRIGQTQIALYQTGGNREGLNYEQLRNFYIPLPPLSEQLQIADYLDEKTAKIDTLIEELVAQLNDLATYKQAVISEAVTGKVDVRDWTPKS